MSQLPAPNTDAVQHSQRLVDVIVAEINTQGPITFHRYMELALYAPGLGYYSAGAQKFGPDGDFVTAPEISPLFSKCLASYCRDVMSKIGGGDILEFGAGSGIMAVDILLELEQFKCLPAHYYILEVSAELKQRQQTLIKEKIPHLHKHVVWLDRLPEKQISGVILANEVLDAMPVHKFKKTANDIAEFYVDRQDDQFFWTLGEVSCSQLKNTAAALDKQLPEDYESEVCLVAQSWIKSLANILTTGQIILIDYGFSREEYYHPQRNQGTLMCHYRHRAHGDVFYYPGLQDITAHVDFGWIMQAAEQAGLDIVHYSNQASFLLSQGLAERVDMQNKTPEQQMALANQIKLLTLPSEMGELFKVLVLKST